MKDKFQQNWFR